MPVSVSVPVSIARWTAQLSLELLPETNRPRAEVYRGCLIISPHDEIDHQTILAELTGRLHAAARRAGCWAYPKVNVVVGDDLFIPDIVVSRRSGAGQPAISGADVLMVVEIGHEVEALDRPRVYAEAKVPWYMRVDFRRRVPTIVLHELVDGAYEPVLACAAGTTFAMSEPFAFSIDPAELLDD
jgi:hypothetical protein